MWESSHGLLSSSFFISGNSGKVNEPPSDLAPDWRLTRHCPNPEQFASRYMLGKGAFAPAVLKAATTQGKAKLEFINLQELYNAQKGNKRSTRRELTKPELSVSAAPSQ
jgi:hypothetical protein